jgi:hypothetical protein
MESKTGIVREMEVAVMMDRGAAASFRDWLTSKIDELDQLTKEMTGGKK